MIDKCNKTAEAVKHTRYIGVASVNVLAVNPDNEERRRLGMHIPDDADEPSYTLDLRTEDGTVSRRARVSMVCRVLNLDAKPLVTLDFWVSADPFLNRDRTKVKVIDSFGRTAWLTEEGYRRKEVPAYADGRARLLPDYRPCHRGEEELVRFLMKYLCVNPCQTYDRKTMTWKDAPDPGRLTIDDWKSLADGDAKEVRDMVNLQPENAVKVLLGVKVSEDNRTYQTFLSGKAWSNGMSMDMASGTYLTVQKAIDEDLASDYGAKAEWSSLPVHEWEERPSDVKPSGVDGGTLFDQSVDDGGDLPATDDDLPFE